MTKTQIVDVRIRHADDVESAPLTTCHIDELNSLMAKLTHWGGPYIYGNGLYAELSGQFVVRISGEKCEAFFEIIAEGKPS